MRVAVTGAAGYIGGWLVQELVKRGHDVHATDLGEPNYDRRFALPWDSFAEFDMLDGGYRRSWLRHVRPDVCVHLAALYGRVWGEKDMVKTTAVNAGLTAELARDCDAEGVRLMYMSSSEVYGQAANFGTVTPYSRLFPMNMYGMSKKWGEEAVEKYCPNGLMVTRLNMPYGPSYWTPFPGERTATSGQPGTVGYNVLHSMVWQASHGMDLVVHRGTTRCLTWVGDSVRGLAMIMESGRAGTWNVCRNDDHRPVEEIARMVVEMTGSTSQIRVEDPPPRVTMSKSLDNEKLLGQGWQPEVELDDGMKRTWEYYRRFAPDGTWLG